MSDILADAPSLREALVSHLTSSQEATLSEILGRWTFLEREIVKLRYGIGGGYTYTVEEVGKIFNVTPERLRQTDDQTDEAMTRVRRFMGLSV